MDRQVSAIATCNYIKNQRQDQSGLRTVIHYVSQDAKTKDENGNRYLSGVNCSGESAFDEFMATKNLFGKRSGVYFYHYEQSFAPGEIKSYSEAHEIGIKLAEKMFPGFEVLVGTHLDAHVDGVERVHNHFVVNSVSYEDGRKLHYGPRTLELMRSESDKLCREHDLSTLKEYVQTYDKKYIGTREYRAACRGDGWKMQAANDIEVAMTVAGTKEEFIEIMESANYKVSWTDTHKYITYTCPNGMKVRDNKLFENKFLKENMENEFNAREQNNRYNSTLDSRTAKEECYDNQTNDGQTLRTDGICDSERTLGGISPTDERYGNLPLYNVGTDGECSDEGRSVESECELVGNRKGMGEFDNETNGEGVITNSSRSEKYTEQNERQYLTGWENERTIFESNRENRRGTQGHGGRVFELAEDNDAMVLTGNNSDSDSDGCDNFLNNEIKSLYQYNEEESYEQIDDEEEASDYSIDELIEQTNFGNIYAKYRLACVYLDEKSYHYNPDKGGDLLVEAAEEGNSWAQYRIGRMCFFGVYFKRSEEYAEYWLKKSANNENSYAQVFLGKAYIEGSFLRAKFSEGAKMLFEAENSGNHYAAYSIGKYYLEGKCFKKDISKAITHFEYSAQMGNIFAELKLSEIYLFEANFKDLKKAVEMLNISAHKGNPYSVRVLERMHSSRLIRAVTNIDEVMAHLPTRRENRAKTPEKTRHSEDYER